MLLLSLPTAYLPPLDYFAVMMQSDRFFIDGNRPCSKQTFANRAQIVTSQGILNLSVPCTKPNGHRSLDKDLLVCNLEKWQRDHWRGIVTAYNKSPYFLYYRDELETFYMQKPQKLVDFNTALLDFIVRKLHLPVMRVENASEFAEAETVAFDFGPKHPEKYHINPYMQTFPCEVPLHNISILDLMFNLGPEAVVFLQQGRPASGNPLF